ncbi:MAG: GNAT family N-acetyltransferase [Bacteroidota bacterium]
MSYELIDNKEAKRFEFHLEGGKKAILEYIISKERIFLTHTEVPQGFEGQGLGSQLIKAVLEEVEKRQFVLVPLCPFVATYIKRHPEWKKLVFKGVRIE